MNSAFRVGLAMVLACAYTSSLWAQAAVGGTVQDDHEAAVAEAKIVLTDVARNQVWQCESDGTGAFLFPAVGIGVYTLEVAKTGFAPYRLEAFSVSIGQRSTLTIRLHPGEVRTVVTVSDRDTALDTQSNALGSVVDSTRVPQLPLNGRNFLQLALLAGGASDISPANDLLNTNVGHPGRAVVLPGTNPYSVGYSINGINVRGSRDGELAVNPSIAAIDEFKVQESFLLPADGPNGAVVNLATKGGANQVHGEAFEFVRNQIFDARSFFAARPEDLKRNQFGFAFGGPLRKDKFWFHSFYEGLREVTGFSQGGYSPTAAMFGGNFAATGRAIYDPAGYDASTGTRNPFPGNSIPASRFNPVARNLSAYYLPGTDLSMLPNNLYGTPRNTLEDDQGGVRLDTSWNARHHLFSQVLLDDSPAVRRGLYPLSGLMYPNRAELVSVEHIWSAGSRAVNVLRAGFVRSIATGGNEARQLGPLLKSIGVLNTFDDRGTGAVSLLGYSSFGRSNGDVGNSDNSWEVEDDFHITQANHSLTFGAGLRYRRGWHLNANTYALGLLRFEPNFTAQLLRGGQGGLGPQPGTGDSWADFLLGMPTSGLLSGLPVTEYRGSQIFPYIQDTFRVTNSLTLNYGLAWYVETPPDPQGSARGRVHGFNPATGLLTYAALGELKPQVMSTDRNNFAPRFGFAWGPPFLKNTVVRAGSGIYYSEFPWALVHFALSVSPPFAASRSFASLPATPAPQYVLGINVFPPVAVAPLDGSYAANLPPGTTAAFLDPGMRTLYVSQWNFSIEHSFATRESIELAYLGSGAHNLPGPTDISQCRPGPDLYCSAATKPWPRYDDLIMVSSSGNSSYEGLIARYRHRTGRGLNLSFEYTLSKTLTDAWQSTVVPPGQIANCRACDKGPATFDVRQRAVASGVWEIPYGRARHSRAGNPLVLDLLAGGWTLTGIATFATGQPILLKGPSGASGQYLAQVPNRICDGRSDTLSGNLRTDGFQWFDTSCFPAAAQGYFGNSGRTVLSGPGLNNWDLGLEKFFPARHRDSTRLLFRAEAFNAWNHAQFQQPNGDAGGGASFGRVSAARSPRLIQLSIKLLW